MAPPSLDIYTPLSITERQIRILQLAPASTLAHQLKCRLQVVSLENHPSFDAISYAWCGQPIPLRVVPRDQDFPPVVSHPSDDPSATKPIVVNDQLWSIGANLDSALRHFRDPITTKYVWADALCINQSDVPERNAQVILMGEIYGRAQMVKVWLGEATQDTPDAIEMIELLHNGLLISAVKELGPACLKPGPVKALTLLLERQWWKRLWVVQEVALARDAVVYCGPYHFRGEEAATAHHNYSQHFDHFWDLPANHSFDEIRLSKALSRLHVLLYCRNSDRRPHAANPRDYVYGLLALLPSPFTEDIRPDYNLPVSAVYSDMTVRLFRATGELTLVGEATIHHNSHQLPSWVPDYSDSKRPDLCHILGRMFHAADSKHLDVCLATPCTLRLSGAHFDKVVRTRRLHVKKTLDPFADPAAFDRWHRQQQDFLFTDFESTQASAYIGGGSIEEAYWKTLTFNVCRRPVETDKPQGHEQHPYCGHLRFLKWFADPGHKFGTKEGLVHDQWIRLEDCRNFQLGFLRACLGDHATLFVTQRGYIGVTLGQSCAEVGDEVYLLAGRKVPYLLRPERGAEGGDKNAFKLVCECYVHGIMFGEAVCQPQKSFEVVFEDALRRLMYGGADIDPNLPLTRWESVLLH
ncbi:hypothetical protein LTS15_003786 [Exophiala xenobiotica]|nr:hypothetical protein LTS15_003786 [Exophiala xenobiotica]